MKSLSLNPDFKKAIMTLERTSCNGTCPVYTLTIYGTGLVVYEGESYVKIKGRRTSKITGDKLKKLMSWFKEIDFSSLKDSYEENTVPDMATAITSITINDKTKSVRHNYGDLKSPSELTRLEHRIDKITNSIQWIK